ncbi:MAG: ArsR/SmtB family transcription factor [Candidatus Anammoxibacter sp.]
MLNAKILNKNHTKLIPFDYMQKSAEVLKSIAHPQRLRIIELLMSGEFTVGEISEWCELGQSITSTHLRLMHSKKLVKSERRDRFVYYSLENEQLAKIVKVVRSQYQKDICECGRVVD